MTHWMRSSRRNDSGFALLLVFAMAGTIAIMLYSQMPRVAFEAQREKEALLVERGEQYIRAIQLFVSKYPRYPSNMDELEKFGGTRFLRKRYKDPMTGKDEWRILKYNAAGQLENSLVQKPEEKKENLNKFISEAPAMVATNAPGTGGANLALRRRASEQQGVDGGQPPNPGDASGVLGQSANPQAATPVLPPDPNNPQAPNQQLPNQQFPNQQFPNQQAPNQQVSNPQFPNQQFPNQQVPNQQQQTNPVYPNGTPGYPGAPPGTPPSGAPGQPQWQGLNPAVQAVQGQILGGAPQGQPGMPTPGNTGYPAPAGYGQTTPNQQQFPGQQPQNQQQYQQQYQQQQQQQQFQPPQFQQQPQQQQQPVGAGGINAPNSAAPNAAQLIMQNLTQPRQMPGNNVPGVPGLALGPGIGGVASTSDAPSIKLYNERQKYNEWEFVYDPRKDKRLQGKTAGSPTNQPGGPLNGNNPGVPTNQPGGPLTGNPGPFGPSPTTTNPQTPNMPPNTMPNMPQQPGPRFPGTPQQGYPAPGAPQQGYPAPGRR